MRKRLGAEAFGVLLGFIESDRPTIQVVRYLRKFYGAEIQQWHIVIWRSVLSAPSRKLLPGLAALIRRPLTLVKAQPIRRKGIGVKTFIVAACMVVASCARVSDYTAKDYFLGDIRTVSVGSVMCSWEYGKKKTLYGVSVKDGYRKELIYNGLSDSTIFIAYREYYFDPNYQVARPAFSNELKYSIRNQQLITYQEMQIHVLRATSESISFSILRDLSTAAAPPPEASPVNTAALSTPAGPGDRYPVKLTTRGGASFKYFYCGESETSYLLVVDKGSSDIIRISKASVHSIERIP